MIDYIFDESRLLYGLGAFLGVISILYFGHELILDLSPTIKSLTLLSGTVVFLSAAEYVRHRVLSFSFYVFSAFSYLSFLTYTFAKFQFSSEQIFLTLAASSVVFIGLGYFKSERGYELDSDQAKKVLGAVAVLVAAAVVFDVTGAQPEYSVELHEKVEVVEGQEFEIGVFEVRNDFLLSRNVETPAIRGCVSVSEDYERNIYIRPDTGSVISGGSTETVSLKENLRSRHDENITVSGNYTVVEGECPSDPEEKTIYVHEGDDSGVLPSVARD